MRRQDFPAGGSKPIIAPPSLACFFYPTPANPATFLEPVEEGIERSDIKMEDAAGTQLDQMADVIAVSGPIFDQGKNQQFGAPLLQFAIENI